MSTREIEIPYPGKPKKVSIPEKNILTMGLPKNAPKVGECTREDLGKAEISDRD